MGLYRGSNFNYYPRVLWLAPSAPYKGAAAAVATSTAALSTILAGAGASLSIATASGSIVSPIDLAGASASFAQGVGGLSTNITISGGALAQTVLSAAMTTMIRVLGSSASLATVIGGLQTDDAFSGFASGESIVTGRLGPNCSFTLAWNAVADATGYRIKWGISPGDFSLGSQDVDQNTLIYAIGGLTQGTTYYFTVAAMNFETEGAIATSVSGIPDVPGATLCSITLAWNAVPNATGYRVKWGLAPGDFSLGSQDVDETTLIYTIDGLTEGTTYYCTVAAMNFETEGDIAAAVSGIPDVVLLPLNCTGQMVASAVATAALSTVIRMQGTANAIASVIGSLASPALSGAVLGVSTPIGRISTAIQARGDVLAGSTVQGVLSAASYAVDGFAQGVASGTGDLTVQITLSGHALSQSLVRAGLTSQIALSGDAIAHAQTSGEITGSATSVSGVALSHAIAQGSLSTKIAMVGTALAEAIASGYATFALQISGFAEAAVGLGGSIATQIRMGGKAINTVAVTGFIGFDEASSFGGGRRIRLTHAEDWWRRIDARIAEKKRKKKRRRRPILVY